MASNTSPSSSDTKMDCRKIANDVYKLASLGPSDPLSAAVKEALDVIDESLDIHGYVFRLYLNGTDTDPSSM